jgi:hypothetical protein
MYSSTRDAGVGNFNVLYEFQRLSESNLPVKKDLVDLLRLTSDLEASQAEHSLSSLLVDLHLSRHTSLLDQLLQHSAALLEALGNGHHKAKVAVTEEEGAATQDELIQQYRELVDRQKNLTAEVAEVKALSVLGEKPQVYAEMSYVLEVHLLFNMQLPSISRFSARLYTSMTGEQSNSSLAPAVVAILYVLYIA